MVAGADGSVDKKEIQAFQKQLASGLETDSALLMRITVQTILQYDDLMKDIATSRVDPQATLERIIQILDTRLPQEEAMAFKVSLIQMGKTIAEASGGFLGLFGSKISKKEKRVLAEFAMMLGLIG